MHPLKLTLSNSVCRSADPPWPIHCFASAYLRFVLAISSSLHRRRPSEVRPGQHSRSATVQSNPFEFSQQSGKRGAPGDIIPITLRVDLKGSLHPDWRQPGAKTNLQHSQQLRSHLVLPWKPAKKQWCANWLCSNTVLLCLKVRMRIVSRGCRPSLDGNSTRGRLRISSTGRKWAKYPGSRFSVSVFLKLGVCRWFLELFLTHTWTCTAM